MATQCSMGVLAGPVKSTNLFRPAAPEAIAWCLKSGPAKTARARHHRIPIWHRWWWLGARLNLFLLYNMAPMNSPMTLPGDDLDPSSTTQPATSPDERRTLNTDIHMTTSPTADERLSTPSHDGKNNNNEGQQMKVQITEPRTYNTLKPYERPRRNRNRRPALHLATAENYPPLNAQPQQNFPKYFTVASESGVNLSEISVIKANREIEGLLGGPPKCITETRADI